MPSPINKEINYSNFDQDIYKEDKGSIINSENKLLND